MPSPTAKLLLHPVRMQIVTVLANRQMTTGELSEIITDVPLTTLYRHINSLVEGGLLKVTSEVPVRGTVEKTYGLVAMPSLSKEDLQGMKKQDYQRAFMVYLSSLMSAAQRYLDGKGEQETFNPLEDGMDLSLGTLYLSDDEFHRMNQKILDIILSAAGNQPGNGREPRMFTYLFIPQ